MYYSLLSMIILTNEGGHFHGLAKNSNATSHLRYAQFISHQNTVNGILSVFMIARSNRLTHLKIDSRILCDLNQKSNVSMMISDLRWAANVENLHWPLHKLK